MERRWAIIWDMTVIARLTIMVALMMLATPLPASADPNCRCRLFGEYYEIGATVCIRGNLRRCEMNLNNTSWKQIADFCPQASLAPLQNAQPTNHSVRYSLAPAPDRFMQPE